MERGFEIQLVECLSGVNRQRSQSEPHRLSKLNIAILILGFISIAIGYTLNSLQRETVARALGGNRVAIEAPVGAESAAARL